MANAIEMIDACLDRQILSDAPLGLVAWDFTEGFVDLKYGSEDEHGVLRPNSGEPYFMKSIVLKYYSEYAH